MTTEKCARCILLRLSARCLHIKCICLQKVCIKSAFSPTGGFPQTKPPVGLQTTCRTRADYAHFVLTQCRLCRQKCAPGALCTLGPSVPSLQKSKVCRLAPLHTLSLVCKVCSKCQPLSGKPSKNLAIQHLCHTQGIPVSSPARSPPPPPCWP